ncbi:MAG: response regulator [Acidobacteriota bacterium]
MAKFGVLLVDDEEEFVRALAERLEIRGYPVRVALSGEQAIELLRETVPDVMVLDLRMPGMDGLEVLRRVKADYPRVQVIILTAHGSERDRDRGLQLGAYEQLQKPVYINDLINTMEQAYCNRMPVLDVH